MALAALIVSILALAASGASATYTYRISSDTRQVRRNDDIRLYGDLRPELKVVMEPSADRRDLGLVHLSHDAAEPIDWLELTLEDASVLVFSQPPVWPRPLKAGKRATWPASILGDGGITLRAQVICRRGDRSWEVPVQIDVPASGPNVW